jgi:murein DD-endopeptidase MepM/ murein hydrolase activator NlpD
MNVNAAAERGAPEAPSNEAQKTQLKRLTQEFEAMFLAEMLRGMRSTMLEDQGEGGLGNDTMIDTFDVELGRSLSMGGGIGLSSVMLEALSRREDANGGSQGAPPAEGSATTGTAAYSSAIARTVVTAQASPFTVAPASAAPGRPVVAPAQAGDASGDVEMPGPVTSAFGWRKDPFSGRAQFHAGTDVRMAYGQEVQSVAPGRVSAVGERSGYGLTVVIDHGNGLETRYAHLSGTDVRVGDQVEAGQVVARSGNSGRSTGPHLHMEARLNGKAVDMASVLKSKA